MAIHYPPAFINAYLSSQIPAELGAERFGNGLMKFFPASPTDIEALTETFPESSNSVFAVYDRMLRMRRSPFPHIKTEQLLYYFYKMAGDPVDLIEATQLVQDLLDREDESAYDLNSWIKSEYDAGRPLLDDAGNEMPLVFFHRIKVYQLEETRDIVDFGTARTYAGNKIIIDYEWHKS